MADDGLKHKEASPLAGYIVLAVIGLMLIGWATNPESKSPKSGGKARRTVPRTTCA